MKDRLHAVDGFQMGAIRRPTVAEVCEVFGVYHVECRRADGSLRWEDEFHNLVTTVGKNAMLDAFLSGSAWSTGTVYLGLKGLGSPAVTDTMASHSGWSELNIASARASAAFLSASGGQKVSNTFSTTITAAGPTDVYGAFIVVGGTSAINNTTGTLYSAGDFTASRSVVATDIVNVTYTTGV